MIDSASRGMTWPTTMRYDRPRNMTARMVAMVTIVWAALRDSGGLNAGMPLEMASVPVMTADPTANARSSRNRENASVGAGIWRGGGAWKLTVKYRNRPSPIMAYMASRKT